MKILSLSLAFLFFGLYSSAQATFVITGKIMNGETGLPLQGASVFAQNTTIGTASDADGNFKIYLPNGGYELVATFTGYTTETRRVSTTDDENKNIVFQLKPREKEMADVTVVATSEVRDGWEKYGSFFTENFIGKTPNSKDCSLKNPEALKFYFSKKKNRLKVIAAEPLLVENKALGYTIKYALDSLTYEYTTDVNIYTGSPLFEEMTAASDAEKAQWMAAREKAYNGSTLQFMRSLYNKKLKEDGYEIQFIIMGNGQQSAVSLKDPYGAVNYKKDDSTQTITILPNQINMGILYNKEKPEADYIAANPDEPSGFQFSLLTFKPKDPLVIEQNGYYYEQNDLSVSGYWTRAKVADLLPYDYNFSE